MVAFIVWLSDSLMLTLTLVLFSATLTLVAFSFSAKDHSKREGYQERKEHNSTCYFAHDLHSICFIERIRMLI